MVSLKALTALALATGLSGVLAGSVIYDGRAAWNLPSSVIDASSAQYLTVVKGTQNASHYSSFLNQLVAPPTPLWLTTKSLPEKTIAISIDNSSVFYPGGNNPQYGFRRTEFIAQTPGAGTADLNAAMETGTTVFHFSIKEDPKKKLNYNHEYQIVFIEPSDGSHVFGIQLGSPFTNPTGPLPAANAHSFKVLDHSLNVVFNTPFTSNHWHNFAVQVDWTYKTLGVFYSKDLLPLAPVTKKPVTNVGVADGSRGEFHFGVLKLPLVNPADSAADQGDVVHHGIQEGTTEGLLYSGVFVESDNMTHPESSLSVLVARTFSQLPALSFLRRASSRRITSVRDRIT